MKKTNILLVLILIINAVILWKVMCCSSHCSGDDKCTAKTECTEGASCEHGEGEKCCKGDKKECKHGKECTHGENCKHGAGCTHGKSCEAKCDSTCKAGHCMTSMMLHMPEEHRAETQKWLKDDLGLSDEQITSMTDAMMAIQTKMDEAHAGLKTEIEANNEMIKGMLSEDQMKKVEEMMERHCKAAHSSCSHKSCEKKCEHDHGDDKPTEEEAH